MASRSTPLLLIAALAGGCGPLPAPRPAHAQLASVLESAALQVRRCYRLPRASTNGRHIVTRLRVRYTPEGDLAGLPVVMMQDGITASNQAFADDMAQAAIQAVMQCAPLRLPPAMYQGGWSDFDLTFSVAVAA